LSKKATELLILCTSLDPKDSFKIDDVCSLASKFYPAEFSEQERIELRCQLQHYVLDVPTNPADYSEQERIIEMSITTL